MNNLLDLSNIKKSFIDGQRELLILKGIDLHVEEHETVSIVGPSGAGKSTLLHIIGALSKPTEGEVKLNGMDLYNQNDKKLANIRNNFIGFIFQFHHLLPEFTALENVTIPLLMRNESQAEAKKKACAILEELGLNDRMTHKPNELSGGEQQRVAIARAMATNPLLILADEPTGNLDQENSEKVQDLLLTLSKQKKQTVIVVTHNENLARRTDRMIKLSAGKIVESKINGAPERT
ncbi:ABC transporter ATP-binding protein [Candidatus Poribacteria bacterium]|nr:ABC transporter ATP-binding protein [Candidatus Poribacteria bacterium]